MSRPAELLAVGAWLHIAKAAAVKLLILAAASVIFTLAAVPWKVLYEALGR